MPPFLRSKPAAGPKRCGRIAASLRFGLLLLPTLACAPPDRAPTASAAPAVAGALLSSSERAGAAVYERENCARCHTLFDAPPARGPFRLPQPLSVDHIGGSRVGPDLGLEGHRRSNDWQAAHLYAPDVLVPGSPMPASRHLFRSTGGDIPELSADARHLIAYLQSLGRGSRDVYEEFRSLPPDIPAPVQPPPSGRMEEGSRLYMKHCVACHGEAGKGDGPAAGLLLFPPRDFIAGHYRFRSRPLDLGLCDEDLFRVITLGAGTGAAMPAFEFLPSEERWALVLRIKEFSPALRGRGVRLDDACRPGAQAAPASPASRHPDGRELWRQLGCGACHGPEGRGLTRREAHADWSDEDGVAVPRSGDLTHACGLRGGGGDEAFARALLFGVGSAMPSFAGAIGDPSAAARALRLDLEQKKGGSEDPPSAPQN